MKNILILGKYSSLEAGGIERVVESWLRCVDQLDETVFFHHVCFNGRHIRCQKRLERHYSEAAFRVNFNLSSQPVSFGYAKEILRSFRNSSLVIIHFPNVYAALILLFVSFWYKKPVIVHWHSDLLVSNFVLKSMGVFIQKFILKKAFTILCTSIGYASYSVQLKKFIEKVQIFPIFLADRSLNYVNSPQRVLAKLGLKRQYLLSVGRLVDYKGFDILIDAFAQVDFDIDLVIVGDGPLRKQLTELARSGC